MQFGGNGALSGGGSVWGGLTSEIVDGAWHISGTVNDYAGFDLYLDDCAVINASAYKGISFSLSGSAANRATPIALGISTTDTTPSPAWLIAQGDTMAKPTDPGTCTPIAGNSRYYHPGCSDPTKSIAVPTAPTTINVLWTDMTGGEPDASPNPAHITAIYFNLEWMGAASTPYSADLTLDDLAFIP